MCVNSGAGSDVGMAVGGGEGVAVGSGKNSRIIESSPDNLAASA